MALAKTSNEIISIRGRFGGVYFKKSPDGQHVQAMPRVWNYTRSPAQIGEADVAKGLGVSGIRGMSYASGLWHMALLAFFSAAWAAYALVYLFSRPGKEPKRITGWNWYIYYALTFPETQRPPFWKPPHGPQDLPHYIVTYQGLKTYTEAPPDWTADNPSDYYWPGLDWHGQPSYRNDEITWFIWWKAPTWIVSPGLDFEPAGETFYRTDLENHGKISGYYRNPVTKKTCHVYIGKPQ